MIRHASLALRVLLPNDLRLVWRDGFLLMIVLVSPLTCLVLRWLVPALADVLGAWVDLERYSALILANFQVAMQPVLLGVVVGILFLEERDEGTLLALQASPLSLEAFLGYRLIAAMVLSTVITVLAVPLAGLVSIPPLQLAGVAVLASLATPVVALGYAVTLENKVQAVTAIKLVQAWGGLPVFLYFAPSPWQWIGSVPGPLYYPIRLFWTAAEGAPEWWLFAPGVAIQGTAVLWLLRRFRHRVHA